MIKRWSTFLAFLAMPVLLAQGPAQNGASISGRVTNSVTGAGVAGAKLTACPANACYGPESRKEAVSDEEGGYRIDGIPDGQYFVGAVADQGFSPNRSLPNLRVSGDTRLDIPITPLANVRGKVLDPDGKPAAGITVNIPMLGVLGQQVTDENGEFVFENLAPLSYTISATPPAGRGPAPQDGTRVVTTYYPSVVDSSQAVRIQVQGVDLFGYDIRLRTALARTVRGRVIDVDGKPAPHASVTIFKLTQGSIISVRGVIGAASGFPEAVPAASPVETKEDGTFEFPPVLEGEWKVRAILRAKDFSVRGGGSVEIAVSARDTATDIKDLEIRLAPPFEIKVAADWGGEAPPVAPRGLHVFSLDGSEGASENSMEGGQPQIIKFLAGPFFIGQGFVAPGYYLAAAMLGNRDVLGHVVEISAPEPLTAIYKTGGGGVQGTVEKGEGAIVALLANATPLGFSARCDTNGRFAIADVPPGEYTAAAFRELGFLFSPEFRGVLAASGKSVRVEAGSAAQVDLRVSK